MDKLSNLIKVVLIIFLLGDACLLAHAKDLQELPTGVIRLDGREAPSLKLKDMDGNSYDLKNARGNWVFVHFWASWCGPCRREMPKIQAINELFVNTKLEILLVNTAENDDTVFSFLGIAAPDLTPLMDYDGLVTERWQPRGLPSTFFVDPQGKLQYLALGDRPWDKSTYLRFLESLAKPSSDQ